MMLVTMRLAAEPLLIRSSSDQVAYMDRLKALEKGDREGRLTLTFGDMSPCYLMNFIIYRLRIKPGVSNWTFILF